jgi:hypothetical protein
VFITIFSLLCRRKDLRIPSFTFVLKKKDKIVIELLWPHQSLAFELLAAGCLIFKCCILRLRNFYLNSRYIFYGFKRHLKHRQKSLSIKIWGLPNYKIYCPCETFCWTLLISAVSFASGNIEFVSVASGNIAFHIFVANWALMCIIRSRWIIINKRG